MSDQPERGDGWVVLVFWLIISFFNFGALNAHSRADRDYGRYMTPREEAGFMAGISLIPIGGTVAAIFTTGFCENGFSWKVSRRGE